MRIANHSNNKAAALNLPELPDNYSWVITEDRDEKGYAGNLYISLWRTSLKPKRWFSRKTESALKRQVVTTKLIGNQFEFMATANLEEAIMTTAKLAYAEAFPSSTFDLGAESQYIGSYTAG